MKACFVRGCRRVRPQLLISAKREVEDVTRSTTVNIRIKIFTPYSVKPGTIRCPRTITDVWARAFGFLRVFAYTLSAVKCSRFGA